MRNSRLSIGFCNFVAIVVQGECRTTLACAMLSRSLHCHCFAMAKLQRFSETAKCLGGFLQKSRVIHPQGQWRRPTETKTQVFKSTTGSLIISGFRQACCPVTAGNWGGRLLTYSLLTSTFPHFHQPETLYLYIVYIII